jgi:hypothetical protein
VGLGSIENPAWTWNVIVTVIGLLVLCLLVRKWFKDIMQAAEDRYKFYIKVVESKQDSVVCCKEHEKVDERCGTHEGLMKEICKDVKEAQRGINNILTHLTGVPHG